MTVNWDDYKIYDPGVRGPLHELSRKDARGAFDRLMKQKAARIEMLERLAANNGVELDGSDVSLQDLNDWLRDEVETDPSQPGRLKPTWYSVVNDIALYLGDLMIGRCPSLCWAFYTGGVKDVSYQRHVLMGFKTGNPKYNVDVDRLLATYVHRIAAGAEVEDDAFWKWLEAADAQGCGD